MKSRVCCWLAALFAIAGLITAPAVLAGGEVLRVTTWGGNYQKSYQVNVAEFEKANNCKVEWVVGSCSEFMVKARMGQADVITNDLSHSIEGETEGLWLKLDPAQIPNMKNLYDNAKYSPYTLWVNVGDYAMAYNSNKIKTPPTSWEALWDPKYKNRVAIYSIHDTGPLGLMIQQAIKRGGSIDNVEPGLIKMAELVKNGNLIGLIDVETQIVSLFELQEAWIGMLSTGRIKDLWDKGKDFIKIVRPKEGTYPMITTINVANTTKKPVLAMKFVNHVLGKATQETFAMRNLYAPTVKNAHVPDDFKYKKLLISGEAFNRMFVPDLVKVSEMKGVWTEYFNRLLSE